MMIAGARFLLHANGNMTQKIDGSTTVTRMMQRTALPGHGAASAPLFTIARESGEGCGG
jgi:hypothetical protein